MKQQTYIDNLRRLAEAHPELRIVPKVDEDVIEDVGFSYWLGGWGDAEIDEITYGEDSEFLEDGRVYFSDDRDDIEEIIADEFDSQGIPGGVDLERMIESEMADIAWETVITVRITPPPESRWQ